MNIVIFLILAFFTGLFTKFVDLKYDNNIKVPEYFVLIIGAVYGFLIAFVISNSWVMAPLWLGIVIGLFLTNKIDAPGHYVGMGSMVLFLAIFGIPHFSVYLLFLFTFVCVAEELLNDYFNRLKKKNIFIKILSYRLLLEVVTFIVALITGFWIMFFMLLSYDVAYHFTHYFGVKYLKK